MTKSKGILPPKRFWTQGEKDYLIANYADNFNEDLAKTLQHSVCGINNQAHRLGLKKSEQFRIQNGVKLSQHRNSITTRLKKGFIPANKGQKMSDDIRSRVQHTFFQKGHFPHNTKSGNGEITRRNDGHLYIRLSLSRWVQLRIHVYQSFHGPIPKGMCLTQIDGDPDNCDLSNLTLITRAENMARNTIHNYPVEIKQAIRSVAKLKKTIQQYEK